jgi:hypothetical protein
MKIPRFLKCKVYINKRNKQKIIVLPSKEIKKLKKKFPKNYEVRVSW